jgi:hypothetical protein
MNVILSVVWSELFLSTPRNLFRHCFTRENHCTRTKFSPKIYIIVCQYIIPYILISIEYDAYGIPPQWCVDAVMVLVLSELFSNTPKKLFEHFITRKNSLFPPNARLMYIIPCILIGIAYFGCGITPIYRINVILSVVWRELFLSTPRKLFRHFSTHNNHCICIQFSPKMYLIVCQYIISYILISIEYYTYGIPPQ